ncbi:ATP-dependent helicase, partial [Enterovibrio sp. FF113]
DDYHHFNIIEKKNNIRLDREQVEGFEVDEAAIEALAAVEKPMAKPEGTGKKKRKKQSFIPEDVWLRK